MNKKKEIIKAINKIAGRYSAYEVFSDWIRCTAISISNATEWIHGKLWEDREAAYLDTMRKYSKEEQMLLAEMTAWLVETLEDGPDDVLGKIYMESGMGSAAAGQFFTPFHLSELSARLAFAESIWSKQEEMTKLTINEPSCGGGAMIIAAAKALADKGINYQKIMDVVAQDLDWKGVYMCYVQLSLLGIKAICVQGNTLAEPFDIHKTDRSHTLFTPAYMGALIC